MAIEGFPDQAAARAYRVRAFWRRLLLVYWIGCLAVIGLGVDRLHPEYRAWVQRMLLGPTVELPKPANR